MHCRKYISIQSPGRTGRQVFLNVLSLRFPPKLLLGRGNCCCLPEWNTARGNAPLCDPLSESVPEHWHEGISLVSLARWNIQATRPIQMMATELQLSDPFHALLKLQLQLQLPALTGIVKIGCCHWNCFWAEVVVWQRGNLRKGTSGPFNNIWIQDFMPWNKWYPLLQQAGKCGNLLRSTVIAHR